MAKNKMAERKMVYVGFKIPIDLVELITNLINKLGGYVSTSCDEQSNLINVHPLPERIRPGYLLRGARFRENMTQKELALAAKIPQSHVSQMENNVRKITPSIAKNFAKILNTDPDHFISPK